MLEMLFSPRMAKREPWTMFFIGLLYASLAILLVKWVFAGDFVNAEYSGWILVIFIIMFSLPFMYYLIRDEEARDMNEEGSLRLLKEHAHALFSLMWLFLGFIVALSFWYIAFGPNHLFDAQIKTYCSINNPTNFDSCVSDYGIKSADKTTGMITSSITTKDRFLLIFTNNIYVLIFTLVFSLIFGAGALFILAWNASVIAAAIGIFSRDNISQLPLGVARYMIHGSFEIGAYFIGALAGGIVSIAIIKHDTRSEKFWSVLQDSLNLIIIAVVILIVAAFVEVFITPILF